MVFYGEHGAELVEEDDRSSLLAHGRDSHKEAFEELAPPPPPWTHLQAQHSSTDVLRECEGRRPDERVGGNAKKPEQEEPCTSQKDAGVGRDREDDALRACRVCECPATWLTTSSGKTAN